MEIRPIFIIGVEHSGTTILYRMLARHPDLAWLSQYSMRGGEVPSRMRVPFYSLINRVGTRALGTKWRKDFGLLTTILPNPYEGLETWDLSLLPNSRKYFLLSVLR